MKTKLKRERLTTRRSPLILILAIACGMTIANLYYNQPLLVLLATDFNASAHTVGLIPTLTQIGYALGILLLVPMGACGSGADSSWR